MAKDSWAAPHLGPEFTHQYVLDLIKWFEQDFKTPAEPFQLNSVLFVKEPEKFIHTLRLAISEGPAGSRAMYGTVQQDLSALKRMFG